MRSNAGEGGSRFTIRTFDPERDLEDACRCFASGFYHNSWPIIDQAEPRFIQDMVRMCAEICAGSFAAEADGAVRGILLGYYPGEGHNSLKMFLLDIRLAVCVLTRRYRMSPLARSVFWGELWGDLTYKRHNIKSDAEVLLLSSEEGYREGIGSALMDRWVEEVRSRGMKRITLGTDTTLNWRFYERYGFKRVKEFPLKTYRRVLPGVDVTGCIYALDL